VSGDDLIVMAPWLVFAAGLAVIGYRLLSHRGISRPGPPGQPAGPGRAEESSSRRPRHPPEAQPTGREATR
jgi:hypothetical protein